MRGFPPKGDLQAPEMGFNSPCGHTRPAGGRITPPQRGFTGLPSSAIDAIGVYCAAVGGMIEILPPAIRADVVKLSLTAHPAEVKSPVRRAFVR